jgi:hypothetical protein
MFKCPHCEKQTISPMRKAIMSPGLFATCKSCSGSSGVRYPSWLAAMIPGSTLMVAALFVSSEPLEWRLNVVGFLLMVILPLYFTPLHREE